MPPASRCTAYLGAALLFSLCVGGVDAATRSPPEAVVTSDATALDLLPARGNVYMLSGAGGNVAIQVGPDGVLLVDTGDAEHVEGVIAAMRKLSPRDLQVIINTHAHPDHVGGNAAITRIGRSVGESPDFRDVRNGGETNFATIYAHENVLARMSRAGGPYVAPEAAWPTDSFFTAAMDFTYNGEGIRILHQPAAHTDGDSFVHFRGSDVVVTGGILDLDAYPVIDEAAGGSIDGIVDALNRLVEITIPYNKQEGGTMVVPGRGRLADEADVVYYRDMITIIRDRIADAVERNLSLEQVLASRPTLGYDGRFAAGDPAAVERFVSAAYRSVRSRDAAAGNPARISQERNP